MSVKKTILFTEKQYEIIDNIAKKEGINFGEAVRKIVDVGLNYQLSSDNIDIVTEIIDERLRAILKPQVERLAAISAKGAIMSATSSYLNAQAIVDFVPKERRREFLEVYEKARLKGIAYVKNQYADKELQEQMNDKGE